MRLLETREADLVCGYIAHPKECLRSSKLVHTEFVCLFRQDHPLIGDEISPELFARLDHVTVKRERDSGPGIGLLVDLGLEQRIKLTVPQITSIPPILHATDLVLTATSLQSRNYSLGVALGQGRTLAEVLGARRSVTEGVTTASAVVADIIDAASASHYRSGLAALGGAVHGFCQKATEELADALGAELAASRPICAREF